MLWARGARPVGNVIQIADGIRKFIVDGGRQDVFAQNPRADHRLQRAGRAEQVAGHGLGGRDGNLVSLLPEDRLDGDRFAFVVQRGGRAVRVDVTDVACAESRVFQGEAHGQGRARAVLGGRGDMVRVVRDAVAAELAQDVRAARLGVFERFQDQDAPALRHQESVTLFVERTRGFFRFIVARRERAHHVQARNGHRNDGRFRRARDHRVGRAAADDLRRLAHRVRAGGASGCERKVWTARPHTDGDHARRAIGDHHWDQKRADTVRAALAQGLHFLEQGDDSADARPDQHPHAVAVGLVNFQAGLRQRFQRGGGGELCEAIHFSGFARPEQRRPVEALHLGRELRLVMAGVELGDRRRARFAFDQRAPRICHIISNRAYASQPGHYHAFSHYASPKE